MKLRDILLIIAYTLTIIFFMPKEGHIGDMGCWNAWNKINFVHGIQNCYASGTDYPPLIHYIFHTLNISVDFINNVHYIKIITFITEIFSFYLVVIFISKSKNLSDFAVLGFNLALLFNSVIWGQVDGIMTFLLVGTLIMAVKKQTLISVFIYTLALNFKLQSIVALPVFLLLWGNNILNLKENRIKNIITIFIVFISVSLLISYPFIKNGYDINVLNAYLGSIDRYPKISFNAYNIWYLLVDESNIYSPDSNLIFPFISYKKLALILFFIVGGIFNLPLLYKLFNRIKYGYEISEDMLYLCSVIGLAGSYLSFFYVNTQMHERYAYPSLIFLGAFFFLSKKYIPYLLASLAFLLNMEHVYMFQKYKNEVYNNHIIFDEKFASLLYFSAIIFLIKEIFPLIKKNKHPEKLS